MKVILPAQSYFAWPVGVTCLHTLAISSTIYRLVHRLKTRRTWWDDYILILPLFLDILLCTAFWFRSPRPYAKNQPLKVQILNSFWMTGFLFTTIIWSTRTVLSLSLVRIFPPGARARKWTLALSFAMGVSWASSLIMMNATCKQTNPFLRVNAQGDCITVGGVPVRSIYVAVIDFTGDGLLVLVPMILFRRINLPRAERRLILTVFCCSILTMISVLSYMTLALNPTVSLGKDAKLIGAGLSHIESATSLLVCNLAVITTCFYRYIKRSAPATRANGIADLTLEDCSCTHSPYPAAVTLTEISDFSILTHSASDTTGADSLPRSDIEEQSLASTFG